MIPIWKQDKIIQNSKKNPDRNSNDKNVGYIPIFRSLDNSQNFL